MLRNVTGILRKASERLPLEPFWPRYAIAEKTLEDLLARHLSHFEFNAGLPVTVDLQRLSLRLGRDDREVALLSAAGQVEVDARFRQFSLRLAATLEGVPSYAPEERAIYIRELKLIDSELESIGYNHLVHSVIDTLTQIMAAHLEANPVYRLPRDDPRFRLLDLLPLSMRIGRGKLILSVGGGRGR